MQFTKMQALGNDFIVINGFKEQLPTDLAAFSRMICDRRLALGADGVLILQPATEATARLTIYNSDGSEAETCGNGLRCAAFFSLREGLFSVNHCCFVTKAGLSQVTIVDGQQMISRVDMGQPRLLPADIPVSLGGERMIDYPVVIHARKLYLTSLSMGNPHCIIFVEDLDSGMVEQLGTIIENHPLFPNRANVEFVQPLATQRLRMRVHERGCGETPACGSGAAAALVAARLNGYCDQQAIIELKYGELLVEQADNHRVYITGPAAFVAQGEILLDSEKQYHKHKETEVQT